MINTVTLNPAMDKVLFLNEFRKNRTNRIQCLQETIGGKGTHVSINLKLMGVDSRAYGICHGPTGRRIMDMLQEYDVDSRFLWKENANTRTNYLLVEDNCDCTVVAERGVCLQNAELRELEDAIARELQPGDYLVLSGDTSNCDTSIYSRLMERVKDRDIKVFLDTSGDALAECIRQKPYLIKPNLEEISALCGRPLEEEHTEDVLAAIDTLDDCEIEIIAVSLGGAGSLLRLGDGSVYQALPPKAHVVNTVGCGDCYLSGLIQGIAAGLPIEESLRRATGFSAATAESPITAGFDPVRARELTAQVRINKLR